MQQANVYYVYLITKQLQFCLAELILMSAFLLRGSPTENVQCEWLAKPCLPAIQPVFDVDSTLLEEFNFASTVTRLA